MAPRELREESHKSWGMNQRKSVEVWEKPWGSLGNSCKGFEESGCGIHCTRQENTFTGSSYSTLWTQGETRRQWAWGKPGTLPVKMLCISQSTPEIRLRQSNILNVELEVITKWRRHHQHWNIYLPAKAQTWPYSLHKLQVHKECLSQYADLSFEQDLEISQGWDEAQEGEGQGVEEYMLG